MSAGELGELEAAMHTELYPVGTRVQVLATGAYGTVRTWGYLNQVVFCVALDEGRNVTMPPHAIARARPVPGWQANAIVVAGS